MGRGWRSWGVEKVGRNGGLGGWDVGVGGGRKVELVEKND